MASKKVSDQILLFEAANFKGTPKQFGVLASKIKESFPNNEISNLISRVPLHKNHHGHIAFNSPIYMNTPVLEY